MMVNCMRLKTNIAPLNVRGCIWGDYTRGILTMSTPRIVYVIFIQIDTPIFGMNDDVGYILDDWGGSIYIYDRSPCIRVSIMVKGEELTNRC